MCRRCGSAAAGRAAARRLSATSSGVETAFGRAGRHRCRGRLGAGARAAARCTGYACVARRVARAFQGSGALTHTACAKGQGDKSADLMTNRSSHRKPSRPPGTPPPTEAPGGIAGTGIGALVQISRHQQELVKDISERLASV